MTTIASFKNPIVTTTRMTKTISPIKMMNNNFRTPKWTSLTLLIRMKITMMILIKCPKLYSSLPVIEKFNLDKMEVLVLSIGNF